MSRGFDQAPVRDRERWVGWVSTAALQPDRKIKSIYRALDTSPIVGAAASINDVLPQLAKAGFCFTVGRSGLEGFITPSDLDRHAARVHFYVLISAVEMALSQILREVVPQRQLIEWMSHARAGATVPGSPFDSYATAKSTGTETHAVEYLYLGEMVEFLHQQRRDEIPKDLRDKLVMVRNLRPTIMHPTRGLATLGAAHLSAVARAGVSAERELQALAQRL